VPTDGGRGQPQEITVSRPATTRTAARVLVVLAAAAAAIVGSPVLGEASAQDITYPSTVDTDIANIDVKANVVLDAEGRPSLDDQ
jgi:hypothetical protein